MIDATIYEYIYTEITNRFKHDIKNRIDFFYKDEESIISTLK